MRTEAGPALISRDLNYRYWLTRHWGPGERRVMWIGLNPSTADTQRLDPTLRRIYDYSQAWGYDGFVMTNLFAFRATIPRVMLLHPEPVGPENDHHLLEIADEVDKIICAWGAHGVHRNRSQEVVDMLTDAGHASKLHALKINKKASTPGHPLYVLGNTRPVPYP